MAKIVKTPDLPNPYMFEAGTTAIKYSYVSGDEILEACEVIINVEGKLTFFLTLKGKQNPL